MKSVKFSSSFKKHRKYVSTLLLPFNSFRSNQIEINKLIVSRLEDVYSKIIDLDFSFSAEEKAIRNLYSSHLFISKQVCFLKYALIVISSILVGVIFYLFSIS